MTAYQYNMTSEAPSWQTMRDITIDSLRRGMKDYLVFTPNHTFVIRILPELKSYFMKQGNLNKNLLDTAIHSKSQMIYNQLAATYAETFYEDFDRAWLDHLGIEGWSIRRYTADQPVTFRYDGNVPASHHSDKTSGGEQWWLWGAAAIVLLWILGYMLR